MAAALHKLRQLRYLMRLIIEARHAVAFRAAAAAVPRNYRLKLELAHGIEPAPQAAQDDAQDVQVESGARDGLEVVLVKAAGIGSYSSVWKGMRRMPDGRRVLIAVKQLILSDDAQDGFERGQAAETELALLSSLPPHPCIVSFHGHCRRKLPSGAELSLILDFCAGGTLADALTGSGPIAASSLRQSNVILTIFAQSCAALAHLHAQQPPVAHCDFKPENLLLYYSHASSGLGSTGGGGSAGEMRECAGVRWKLCDFGSVRTEPFQFVEKVTSMAELAVEEDRIHKSSTPQYRAPEMYDLRKGDAVYTAVDVWALGVMLYRLIFGRELFPSLHEVRLGVLNFDEDRALSDETLVPLTLAHALNGSDKTGATTKTNKSHITTAISKNTSSTTTANAATPATPTTADANSANAAAAAQSGAALLLRLLRLCLRRRAAERTHADDLSSIVANESFLTFDGVPLDPSARISIDIASKASPSVMQPCDDGKHHTFGKLVLRFLEARDLAHVGSVTRGSRIYALASSSGAHSRSGYSLRSEDAPYTACTWRGPPAQLPAHSLEVVCVTLWHSLKTLPDALLGSVNLALDRELLHPDRVLKPEPSWWPLLTKDGRTRIAGELKIQIEWVPNGAEF